MEAWYYAAMSEHGGHVLEIRMDDGGETKVLIECPAEEEPPAMQEIYDKVTSSATLDAYYISFIHNWFSEKGGYTRQRIKGWLIFNRPTAIPPEG